MKATTIIATLLFGVTMAAPGAISLKRSFLEVDDSAKVGISATPGPCVECPCNGWTGVCKCVHNGCCKGHCKW